MLSKPDVLQRYMQSPEEMYLSPSAGLEIVDECQKNDLAVIGIETFVLKGDLMQPRLDLIADYSSTRITDWHEYRAICNASATLFLKDLFSKELLLSDPLVVSFVISSQSEWLS
jgi:hypothetical protein